MNQYILKYKPNGAIIGWFCTKEAAWERMKYLTDDNSFGVFEVQVSLDAHNDSFNWIGVIIKDTGAVLATYANGCLIEQSSRTLIEHGYCVYKNVQFKVLGKELKMPKVEEEGLF